MSFMSVLTRMCLLLFVTIPLSSFCAFACDRPSDAVATDRAQLVITSNTGAVHIGELIRAALILPKGSRLQDGNLTRASCTSFHFALEPQSGWHDPWVDWYYSGIRQHATGEDGPSPPCGVRGGYRISLTMTPPPPPPPQIDFILNEWVQFDQPGTYRVSLRYRARNSGSSAPLNDSKADRQSDSSILLVTEPIEIKVLPEPDATERAANAFTFLRASFRDDDPAMGSVDATPFPDWTAYSHSEAVVPLLAEFYEQSAWLSRGALITCPNQARVVREMESQLASPRHSVSFSFLEVLAFNKARLQNPDLFTIRDSNTWTEQWEHDSEARNKAFLAALSTYTGDLLTAIYAKDEAPQRDSLRAVLVTIARWDLPAKEELRERAINAVVAVFPKLQSLPFYWEEEWRVLASPKIIPILRSLITQNTGFEGSERRHLYELAPEEARRAMISAAQHNNWDSVLAWASVIEAGGKPSASLDSAVFHELHGKSLDDDFRQQLELLLLKYGGPDVVKPASAMLSTQTCLGEPVLWDILLKYHGAQAEHRLLRRYQHVSTRPGCRSQVALQNIFLENNRIGPKNWKGFWSPALEKIVATQLNGASEDSVAINAANLLSRYGSAEAEPVLWRRLERWHRSPSARPSGMPLDPSNDLEQTLFSALLNGYRWVLDRSAIARLHALCVYDCQYLNWARSPDELLYLTVNDNLDDSIHRYSISSTGSPMFSVDDFQEWMKRFTSGTKFSVHRYPGGAPLPRTQIDKDYPELAKILRQGQFQVVNIAVYDQYGRCFSDKPPDN